MTTPKPALPEPVPPNAEGSTTCIVRWMVTTRDGLWLGAWDKEAFAAYTQAAIDAAVAEARAVPADWADQVEQRLLTWRQRMMNRSGDRLALDDFMGQDSIDDLIDFVCAPLAATPSPAEQPKPAVLDRAAPASEGSGGDATEASLSDTKPLDDPRLQQLFGDAIEGALAFGYQGENAAPPGHWLERFWHLGRAEAEKTLAATPPPMPARLNDQRIVELMRPLADDALIRPHVIAAARAVIAEYERLNGISATPRQPLSEARIEEGRHETFSTNNPFCPCDSKTMLKAVRWAERAHGITPAHGKETHG